MFAGKEHNNDGKEEQHGLSIMGKDSAAIGTHPYFCLYAGCLLDDDGDDGDDDKKDPSNSDDGEFPLIATFSVTTRDTSRQGKFFKILRIEITSS
jgi:hypothetical protein